MCRIAVAAALACLVAAPISAEDSGKISEEKRAELRERQMPVAELVTDLTMQLMLMAAGVFAIVGGMVSASRKKFSWLGALTVSLAAFAGSVFFGYLLHGIIFNALGTATFALDAPQVLVPGLLQFGLFLLGSMLFVAFVFRNLR